MVCGLGHCPEATSQKVHTYNNIYTSRRAYRKRRRNANGGEEEEARNVPLWRERENRIEIEKLKEKITPQLPAPFSTVIPNSFVLGILDFCFPFDLFVSSLLGVIYLLPSRYLTLTGLIRYWRCYFYLWQRRASHQDRKLQRIELCCGMNVKEDVFFSYTQEKRESIIYL